jgi:DNA-binding response OmpR family regulator
VKVCIIDDNKSITGMIAKLLKMKGHEYVIINDGREGLSALEKEVYDVVILDIAMPDFSGFDIINSLNESGRIKDQKICVLTASSAQVDLHKLRDQGVKQVLHKPLDIEELMSELETIVNSN